MRRHFVVLAVVAVATLVASVAAQPGATAERFWPQWRGPHATGASRTANPPTEWSETRNVRWKVEIPGRGSGSPVVWGDRLFLLSAVPMGAQGVASHEPRGHIQPRDVHRFIVLAIDRRTGRVVWERTAREERPRQPSMKDGTWASSSAITDGQRVYAFFESSGLYAYDMAGNLLWQKHLGEKKMFADVGESGSTPVLHGNRLVIAWDHQGASFVVALDARTGQEVWRADRQEVDSWSTPLVVEHAGRSQVVTTAQNRIRSYDLETGKVVWESEGLTMNPIPSPVACGRDGLRDERISGQSLEGNPSGGCQGRHHWRQRHRVDPGSRYSVRAFASVVRGPSVCPQEQLGNPVGLRREDRQAALSVAAPCGNTGGLFVTGRRAGSRLRYRTRRDDARHPAWCVVRSAGDEHA